ncbi:MAG: response regulator FixJ [Methanomassiliicoccales archaeon PtaU1.Bin124]|nr:MAG: response regulator FixJ [Methanomassiliicoccales archaeon PtaU1.Bin124]
MGWLIKTLYVDDDPTLLDLAKEFLEGENDDLSVTTCTSAKDVLSLMRNTEYDVIISDYQMPIMSGIDLLKELRSHGVDIPFILFTGRGREEIAVDALNNGADFYLNKGGNPRVQFTELMNLVRHMVMKRQAIEALKHNAERFRAMIENSLDLIIILNPDGIVRYASPSVKKVLGLPVETIIGQSLESMVHEEDRSRFKPLLASVAPVPELVELRIRRGDTGFTHVEGSFSRSKDGEGRISIIFNARDITKRHSAEEMMKESEERYRALFDLSPSGMLILDENVIDCNEQAATLLGLDRSALIGRTVSDLSATEDAGNAATQVFRFRTDGTGNGTFAWNAKGKDGATVLLSAALKKVNVQGRPRLLFSFTQEPVTEPAQVSIADETCRTILTTTSDAVMLLDKDGIVTFHSPRAGRMFGHGPELTGIRMLDLVDLKEQEHLAKDLSASRQDAPVTSRRYRFLSRDGAPVYAELSARSIPETGHLVCVFRDVTGSVLAEEQALSANRHLAEAGEMLRQDVGKNLIALIGQLQLMQFHYRDGEIRGEMERAISTAQKALSSLDNAKAFSMMTGQGHNWSLLPDILMAVQGRLQGDSIALKFEVGQFEVLADELLGSSFEKLLRHMIVTGSNVKNVWVRTINEKESLVLIFEDDGAGYNQSDLDLLLKGDKAGHPVTFAAEVAKDSNIALEGKAGPDGLQFRWTFRSGRWRRLG